MQFNSWCTFVLTTIVLGTIAMSPTAAEEFDLAQSIQKDLVLLGYDPGNVDGEVTLKMAVAISKFQAENDMEVTGEVTPQLAGILSARVSGPTQPKTVVQGEVDAPAQTEAASVEEAESASSEPGESATSEPGESATPEPAESVTTAEPVEIDPEKLKAAQQECIEKKMAEAREAEKKKRGYASLASAISRSAAQLGSEDVAAATGDIYAAGATASDLSSAASDLGLTEDDLAECENPL